MNDTINRQQTITALRALSDEDGYINAPHEVVTDVVRGLPPVQAEHGQTTQPEQGKSDKLAAKTGETWINVTCPNCGCEIHIKSPAQPESCEITDEQAIEHLQSTGWMQNHDRQMYEMGLKEQLADDSGSYDSLIPNKDCISRQAAIDIIEDFPHGGVWNVESMEEMVYRIKQLPSAPERKTGKWIDGKRMKNDGTFYWFRQCDQCGYERNDCDAEKDSNFCPDCGADMRGEAE